MSYIFSVRDAGGTLESSIAQQVPLARRASYPDEQVAPTWPTGAAASMTLGRAQRLRARAFQEGRRAWVDLYPENAPAMRVTHEVLGGFRGLGVTPALAAGVVGLGGAIGGLLAVLQNALDDPWTDTNVFNDHAKTIHSAMLAIQCLLGGSQGAIVDLYGNTICAANTPPSCSVSDAVLREWRTLRDGFSSFWKQASESSYGVVSITEAEAGRMKQYAVQFASFYDRLEKTCSRQGVKLPARPPTPDEIDPKSPAGQDPAWLSAIKWGAISIGALTLFVLARTAKDVLSR